MYLFTWPQWGYLAALRIVASVAFGTLAMYYRGGEGICTRGRRWAGCSRCRCCSSSPRIRWSTSSTGQSSRRHRGGLRLPALRHVRRPQRLSHHGDRRDALRITAGRWRISWPGLRLGDFPVQLLPGSDVAALLLSSVATLAAMSQLHFLMALVNQSSHDKLTGTYARRIGEEMLNLQFGNARRNKRPLSLVFVDLDDFKKVNDRYGHDEGDRVLRTAAIAAERVAAGRSGDPLGRGVPGRHAGHRHSRSADRHPAAPRRRARTPGRQSADGEHRDRRMHRRSSGKLHPTGRNRRPPHVYRQAGRQRLRLRRRGRGRRRVEGAWSRPER